MSVINPRTSVLTGLIAAHSGVERPRVLVVGCGRGIEAAVLAQDLDADVTGIDLDPRFDPDAARYAHLALGDATGLAFPDASFDIVYSYHALEHIPDYHKALDEMHRVLRKGGAWCIGTPNRARLLGYVGGGSSWREKLAWNLTDWRMRLTGRFRNEHGAHAGFTSGELRRILAGHFSEVNEVTNAYYRRLYAKRRAVISFLIGSGLGRFLFPSVYFLGRK
jgi:ubiquinone/menaquinone biosynthesis C-methylase UbiE